MITTASEVKARLNITSSDYDTWIGAILDEVELEFIKLTGNKFLNNKVSYSNSQVTFTNSTGIIACANALLSTNEYFVTGWYFVEGSVHNDGWKQITNVSETELTSATTLVDEDAGYNIKIQKADFPDNVKSVLALMVGERLQRDYKATGIRSESIGSYSVTYEDGYSKDLMKKINNYRSPTQLVGSNTIQLSRSKRTHNQKMMADL